MTPAQQLLRLSLAQQAAVARVAYALEKLPSVVLLCGPAGVGKTFVLQSVAYTAYLKPRSIALWRCDELLEDRALMDDCTAKQSVGRKHADILLVDDSHLLEDGQLSQLVDGCRKSHPSVGIVLAGEGRLLSLVSRNSRLEQLVRLRAMLPPFSLAESSLLVAGSLTAAGSKENRAAVARTIHEIAAGIPALVMRLADLAEMLASSNTGHVLVPNDIETLYRRLSLNAA